MTLMLVFVFVLAAYLGVELISKVPSQLHTPLMSGTNAISGITIVGAISATAAAVTATQNAHDKLGLLLGVAAVLLLSLK